MTLPSWVLFTIAIRAASEAYKHGFVVVAIFADSLYNKEKFFLGVLHDQNH
jgi:hypothetical protein